MYSAAKTFYTQKNYPMGNNIFKAIESSKWYKVLEFCEQKPDHVRNFNTKTGKMYPYEPLHLACMHGAPKYVIDALIRVNPKILATMDTNLNLPIHYACWNGVEDDILLEMLRACPASAKSMSASGNTPLHCACIGNGVSPKGLRMLIQVFPGAITVQNRHFSTPLQIVQSKRDNFKYQSQYIALLSQSPSEISNAGNASYISVAQAVPIVNSVPVRSSDNVSALSEQSPNGSAQTLPVTNITPVQISKPSPIENDQAVAAVAEVEAGIHNADVIREQEELLNAFRKQTENHDDYSSSDKTKTSVEDMNLDETIVESTKLSEDKDSFEQHSNNEDDMEEKIAAKVLSNGDESRLNLKDFDSHVRSMDNTKLYEDEERLDQHATHKEDMAEKIAVKIRKG